MPGEFGAWQTVYDRFARWRGIGVFAAPVEGMIAEVARRGQADMSLVRVDSTVARARHDAAAMVVEPEVLAALEGAAAREKGPRKPGRLLRWPTVRQLGSPSGPGAGGCVGAAGPGSRRQRWVARRGGLTSKVHRAAGRRRRPLAFVLTPGQAAGSPRFITVLEKVRVRGPVGRPRARPDAVAAGKAYSSRAGRACLRRRGIKAVIAEKAGQAANRNKRGRDGGRQPSRAPLPDQAARSRPGGSTCQHGPGAHRQPQLTAGAIRASAGINTSEGDVARLLHAVDRLVSTEPPVRYRRDPLTGDFYTARPVAEPVST